MAGDISNELSDEHKACCIKVGTSIPVSAAAVVSAVPSNETCGVDAASSRELGAVAAAATASSSEVDEAGSVLSRAADAGVAVLTDAVGVANVGAVVLGSTAGATTSANMDERLETSETALDVLGGWCVGLGAELAAMRDCASVMTGSAVRAEDDENGIHGEASHIERSSTSSKCPRRALPGGGRI